MVNVIWTELALEDLKSVHDYITKDSALYANRFIYKLVSRVRQLEAFPKSGRIVPEFGSENIRELIEGNYRIVYKVDSEYVFVTRIQHSGMLLREI